MKQAKEDNIERETKSR